MRCYHYKSLAPVIFCSDLNTLLSPFRQFCSQVYHLWKSSGVLKIKWRHFKPDFTIIKGLVSIASPATFQFIIASASWIFLASMVAEYGSAASAGYQTAIRLIIFFILPAWGMSNAVATLVGQNLGAKLPERAEQ